jgi:ADP-ribose pyrophosphatase YjhB (NUDIX family)
MQASQVIYYNNKPIRFIPDNGAPGGSSDRFLHAFEHLDHTASTEAVIVDKSLDILWKLLLELCTPINAAGGVVVNEQQEILFIHRRGKWDLPKGKCDEGEDIADCAIREVIEETGLTHVTLKDKICDTYHIYMQGNQRMLKCTAWYCMEASSSDSLTPQAEESITDVKWITTQQLGAITKDTYEAIREVLKKAGYRW